MVQLKTDDHAADWTEAAGVPDNERAFEFVQKLAAEVSAGRVDLPSFPDVAIRVREVVADPEVTNDRIAKVIVSDAGLATRMLALANSAALSRGGKAVTDVKLAVTRVGHDNVRSAALAYALAQIRSAETLAHIRADLARLWETSTLVAALARVLAVKARAGSPDEALLAGLLHNVGRVYILARIDRHEALFSQPNVREALMQDWHAQIGKAIACNWGLTDRVADAIGDQDLTYRADAVPRDLLDVLSVALRAADYYGTEDDIEVAMAGSQSFQRLALDAATLRSVMTESAEDIAGLRAALGD
jgi:HD-like signal output (HDOD) protein